MGEVHRPGAGRSITVIDGGLSTQLERRGHDVSGSLWTARLLLEDPAEVQAAHTDMIRAGADVVITASYQISRAGFVEAGRSARDADEALRRSVQVARRAAVAADGSVLVAASVGPYGAITHDGAEYRGRYGLSLAELTAFHAERLAILIEEQPDLLAIETIPDLDEVEAIIAALRQVPRIPVWFSVTARDGGHLWAGQSIEDAARMVDAAASGEQSGGHHRGDDAPIPVIAFGVNCTDPRWVAELLTRAGAVTRLPLLAYPNAGGDWMNEQWQGAAVAGHAFPAALIDAWVAAGATMIGGCCGTDDRDVARIRLSADTVHE